MKISFIDIQNFRKLKNCRIEFSENETVFVGANNSGKTSAMNALIMFLKKNKDKNLATIDFTLSNWGKINQIADEWIQCKDINELNLDSKVWQQYVPSVDIWLEVQNSEVHYVSHIIPTLDWNGGKIGIRLILEPRNVEELFKAYKTAYDTASQTIAAGKNGKSLKLWPQSMKDFLEEEFRYLTIKAYTLDPVKCSEKLPQALPVNSEPIDGDPLDGLIKIDIINAQRGFSDQNSEEDDSNNDRRLSSQLRKYYEKHLNPSELPDANDLDALEAIEAARDAFDLKLRESFKSSISELEDLNYPGFSDPQIFISSKVNPIENLNHSAAVQFSIPNADNIPGKKNLCLPEKYNGLGFQNLISMIFNLIRFRDEWMRLGKAGKRNIDNEDYIEPLHLVLIEEPEAHLHAQVQQVFIKKAYTVLRNHKELKGNTNFSTQLVISTHSSHIAHEIDFTCLRYFKREPASCSSEVPCAKVVNLTKTFGDDTDTAKFATRYLKTTHCDLFFADAAILVEGPAERMLIPHFIRNKYPELDKSYISLLEIGGSHAHRLRPLLDTLELLSLVITDLDSVEETVQKDKDSKDRTTFKKILPEKGKKYLTNNDTIKSWIPAKTILDEVLDSKYDEKVESGLVRVAYQYEIPVTLSSTEDIAIPYTFEDALVLTNIDFFKTISNPTGLIKKMVNAISKQNISEARNDMFNALGANSKKAEMALELLYLAEPSELEPPKYIAEGLEWLKLLLKNRNEEYVTNADIQGAN